MQKLFWGAAMTFVFSGIACGAEHTTDTLEAGIVRGLNRTDMPVVGIEQLETEPSQIDWYRDRGLASVDSVDQLSGRAALVFALAGADGAYGLKSSAEALLPRVVGGVSRP